MTKASYPGFEDKPIEAHVYADAGEVELFQNKSSFGRRPTGPDQQHKAIYQLLYKPGELEVVTYRNGVVCGSSGLATLGQTVGLELVADRPIIRADGFDLCFVKIRALDPEGLFSYLESGTVTLTFQGGGDLIAFGNADPKPDRLIPFKGVSCPLYHGEALAVIRSSQNSAGCRLIASLSADLQASVSIGFQPEREIENSWISEITPGVLDLSIGELMDEPQLAAVLRQLLDTVINHPMFDKMKGMSLRKLAAMGGGQMLSPEKLVKIERELNAKSE